MASDASSVRYLPAGTRAVKIVVLGALGVGKTTYIGTISEIVPLCTDEPMTEAGELVDRMSDDTKSTTTVAMDFGRRTLDGGIVVYLFGAPGQPRFADMIRSLLDGALGGLVLVDTRDLGASFESMCLLEEAGVPYVVAINTFANAPFYDEEVLRDSLTLPPDRPLVHLDARDVESAKTGLITLIEDILRPLRSHA
ncbi:ATP/GTP-binding protein (plasmid) [Streptomyces sp. NBC_00445]|uniref:GTP-binding protein n=1 Tax=Streptomyces sp. NBC_00445 TaxID=2975745 RepID=UPI002E20DC61